MSMGPEIGAASDGHFRVSVEVVDSPPDAPTNYGQELWLATRQFNDRLGELFDPQTAKLEAKQAEQIYHDQFAANQTNIANIMTGSFAERQEARADLGRLLGVASVAAFKYGLLQDVQCIERTQEFVEALRWARRYRTAGRPLGPLVYRR
jgi:hypothetical protein